MSQVTYTELEGFPIRWAYGQAMPIEEEKIVSTEPKTWSVSTTPSTQIQNPNTGLDNDVYASNMIAQIFNAPSSAVKVTGIQLYGRKVGSPPNPLQVEVRTVRQATAWEMIIDVVAVPQSAQSYVVRALVWAYQSFTLTSTCKVMMISFYVSKTGSPPDLVVEVRPASNDIPGSTIIASYIIPASQIGTSFTPYNLTLNPPLELPAGQYALVFHTLNNGGDSSNYYLIPFATGNPYPGGLIGYSNNGGSTWSSHSSFDAILSIAVESGSVTVPAELVLASASIAPGSVGTSNAWINITLSTPIVLRPNETYALIIYTLQGDSGNKYVIQHGAKSLSAPARYLITFNSGGTWISSSERNISFRIDGVQYTRLYSGSRSPPFTRAPASPILVLFIYAQTSTSMEFAGFDDYTLAAAPVSSTATSQTKIIVLAATNRRDRNPGNITQISWEIWAAGSGLATKAGTQAYAYYNKTPVTPRDFGFSELYLIQARGVDAGSIAIINDHFAGILYFASPGDTFIPPSMFRVPIKKIHVMQGRITFDLLGVL